MKVRLVWVRLEIGVRRVVWSILFLLGYYFWKFNSDCWDWFDCFWKGSERIYYIFGCIRLVYYIVFKGFFKFDGVVFDVVRSIFLFNS